ncbi:ComEC family competence protein [Flavobacterium sp. CHNK8]|uniref:ComEC/Rec2 family competence protein n=1 Tax=Flavobacterium sp. CHNK8 TaxID=2871165 RepID=UPI001C8E49C7|nr:ComEC/Rec2 family competence protein [Flavobacterium sp. CHNK8]QZK89376.1 ComEC family competence protein [Flavobacterium sp. CHNK8]
MKVLHFPLIKITIGFIIGLVLSHYIFFPTKYIFVAILLSVFGLGVMHFFLKKNINTGLLLGINILLLAGLVGVSTQRTHSDSYKKSHYLQVKNIFEQEKTYTLIIREKLKKTSFSDRYVAIVTHINNETKSGKIVLNINNDSIQKTLKVGNIIQLKTSIHPNTSPKNPYQFDYGKYLENKHIYGQMYTSSDDIKIAKQLKKDLWHYSDALRTRILKNLQHHHFNNEELQVAMALILGQQQEISPTIIKDYQYAGAVHILSVSGLHIGFILMFMTLVLKPIPNNKKGSWIKLFIILTSLILFGILAGLAPSVVRSVTMFSFIAIGNHLRRSVNIYHTLIVSILIILLIEPSFLFDVGFQLSYLALFFIIWLQPMLSLLYQPKNKLTKYFWDILTLSFAAQIGTLPLSIYYFHQFPGLFFISNIIVIPLLGVIMVLGVLVMLCAAVYDTPQFLSQLFEWSIYFLNKIIHSIASFEQFIIRDIPFHFFMLVSAYISIICMVFWIKKPSFNKLVGVLTSIIVMQAGCIYMTWQDSNISELIVFHLPKETLITVKHGIHCKVYCNTITTKENKAKSNLNTYLLSTNGIIQRKQSLKNFIYFKGKRIFVLDSAIQLIPNINPDVLLLTQSTKVNLDRVLMELKPKMVVADGSNFRSIQQTWKKSCDKQKIPFHMTHEKGSYSMK